MITFQSAREAYSHENQLKSAHTQSAYLRGVDLFLQYLNDRHFQPRLPLQHHIQATIEDTPLTVLTEGDEVLFLRFTQWLQNPNDAASKRHYSPATVELRLAGVFHWFEFLQTKGWLPSTFSLHQATLKKTTTESSILPPKTTEAIHLEHDLTNLLIYYQQQKPSRAVQNSPTRFHQWELSRRRNHALLQVLGETGGQVSAVLSLNVADVAGSARPLEIALQGKNEHPYPIILDHSLGAIQFYLALRVVPEANWSTSPLFVSHDERFNGQRMSRVIAWRIVQRAAKGAGLADVSPHDLRHWRAKQLIETGHTPPEVQHLLGHRTLHTILAYYGHWFPA